MTLLIEKEGQNHSPDLTRPICVSNAEGHIYFLCVAANIISYMLPNGYIDLSQQKAFLPGVAGCLEHASDCGFAGLWSCPEEEAAHDNHSAQSPASV